MKKIEKAYGGCKNCYGKGYATRLEHYSGRGEIDLGTHEIHIEGQSPYYVLCECGRGRQIQEMITKVLGRIKDEQDRERVENLFAM